MTTWLFYGALVFAVVFFLGGYVLHGHDEDTRLKGRTGFWVVLPFVLFLGYCQHKEAESFAELKAVIEPPPKVWDYTVLPGHEGMQILAQHMEDPEAPLRKPSSFFMLNTRLTPAEVEEFYRDPGHCNGWALQPAASSRASTASARMLVFTKPDKMLIIMATNEFGGAHLTYAVDYR